MVKLNRSQQYAYNRIISGDNIFLTGKAGVGKSFVINEAIKYFDGQELNVLVTAPTGIAALNIEGATLHRTFKIPIKPLVENPTYIPGEIKKADVIILDEISMCRFDVFAYVAKIILEANKFRVRNLNKKEIQFIVVGDFFQLPPVVTDRDREILESFYKCSIGKGFAFLSTYWNKFNFEPILLDEVVRQSDFNFINNLNRARVGLTDSLRYFWYKSCKTKIIGAITLCGTNKQVREINEYELGRLNTKEKIYKAVTIGEVQDTDKATDEDLRLKVGARVMFLVNDQFGKFVNGTFGTVKTLCDDHVDIITDEDNYMIELYPFTWEIIEYKISGGKVKKKIIGTFSQLPIKLAYAATMHKSQGQTYEKVNINPYCWDCGQLYVALSRAKSIDKIHFLGPLRDNYLIASKEVNSFYYKLFGDKYI